MKNMPNILYLSYTGLLEPLGRSQVLEYLLRLSKSYSITLVTFEKSTDFENKNDVERLKLVCEKFGINWQPKVYHQKPRILSSIFDLFILFFACWKECRNNQVKLIHSRGYIPSIAAWLVGAICETPFIFDMRALWLEELIEGKRLKRNSFIHKNLNKIKASMLRDAAAVISLTQVAVDFLKSKYVGLEEQTFVVIPTCVDISKFTLLNEKITNQKYLVYGTMGSVLNSRFRGDWLFNLFSKQYINAPDTKFKIVSRDSSNIINTLKRNSKIDGAKFELTSSNPQDIVEHIKELDVAVIFFTPGISTLGTSPTRIGEFLACGIPVIVNRNVGDTAELVERFNVGVVIDDGSDESLEDGLSNMQQLLKDNKLSARCIQTANKVFSVDNGAQKYSDTYQKVLSNV